MSEDAGVVKLLDALTKSNDPLDDGEVREIERFRTAIRQRMATTVEDTPASNIQSTQSGLQALLDACDKALSPIRRIPYDLLREIFLCMIPHYGYTPPSKNWPPMSISHVCRFWRGIALTTPELWSTICVARIGDCTPKYVHEYLARAGHSLTLRIKGNFLTSYQGAGFSESILFDISPFASRIKALELHYGRNLPYLRSLLGINLDELAALNIYIAGCEYAGIFGDNPIPLLEHAKSLRSLTVKVDRTHPYRWTVAQLGFPWGQLTHVVLEGIHPYILSSFLSKCLSLRDGGFNTDIKADHWWALENPGVPLHVPQVSLSYLQRLQLALPTSYNPGLLRRIDFSNITELDLSFYSGYLPEITLNWSHFHAQVTHLRSFLFKGQITPQICDIFTHTPHLRSLTVHLSDGASLLIAALAVKQEGSSGNVLPNLANLHIYANDNNSFNVSPRAVAHMVASRLKANLPPSFSPLQLLAGHVTVVGLGRSCNVVDQVKAAIASVPENERPVIKLSQRAAFSDLLTDSEPEDPS